jgi:hypothetical protein
MHDIFAQLPSPGNATGELLHQIGLQPEPFQQWLDCMDAEVGNSYRWSDVLRMYVNHCDMRFEYLDDPVRELQQYGLTKELSEKIVDNVGERYGAMLPAQYVVSAVETRLSMELLQLLSRE